MKRNVKDQIALLEAAASVLDSLNSKLESVQADVEGDRKDLLDWQQELDELEDIPEDARSDDQCNRIRNIKSNMNWTQSYNLPDHIRRAQAIQELIELIEKAL